jgi:hypothetical protein
MYSLNFVLTALHISGKNYGKINININKKLVNPCTHTIGAKRWKRLPSARFSPFSVIRKNKGLTFWLYLIQNVNFQCNWLFVKTCQTSLKNKHTVLHYYATHRTVESYKKFVLPPLPQTSTTAPTYFCMFTILILNKQSTFNCNCYQEPNWLFKIRIVNMQKYVGAVMDVCGSAAIQIFYAIPQFGKFRNNLARKQTVRPTIRGSTD